MIGQVLLDTGPLVALLDRSDAYHGWAVEQMRHVALPFLTADAVVTEAAYLTRKLAGAWETLHGYIREGHLVNGFDFARMANRAFDLMLTYRSVSMDYADACLVVLNEHHSNLPIMTLDSDFQVYRRHSTQPIKLLAPFAATL
jgi:predicted nucleic acid-binding protein